MWAAGRTRLHHAPVAGNAEIMIRMVVGFEDANIQTDDNNDFSRPADFGLDRLVSKVG